MTENKQPSTRVTLGLVDGTTALGQVTNFVPSMDTLAFQRISFQRGAELSPSVVDMAMERITYVAFHKKKGESQPSSSDALQELEVQVNAKQNFHVFVSNAADVTAEGIFAHPMSQKSPFSKFFFFRDRIQSIQDKTYIGTLLMEQGLLTEEQLERGLAAQQENKTIPIGKILTNDEMVPSQILKQALKTQESYSSDGVSKRLGEILVEEGCLTEEQLDEALAKQKEIKNERLGQTLVRLEILSEEAMTKTLAKKFHLSFVDLDQFDVSPEAIQELPLGFIEKYRVLPIAANERTLTVALSDPLALEALDMLRFSMTKKLQEVMATGTQIERYIAPYLKVDAEAAHNQQLEEMMSEFNEQESDASIWKLLGKEHVTVAGEEDEKLMIKLINRIIIDAYRHRASDIHIEPNGPNHPVSVRFRVDGVCQTYRKLPANIRMQLISRLKVMARLDLMERRRPQDGRIKFRLGKQNIELRVACMPTGQTGEDIVLRILTRTKTITFDQLQLSESNAESLRKAVFRPSGMILVVGPTGSGKTTTLHALLHLINSETRKIWTAEDPIEITQQGIRQMQIQHHIGFDFATAMRSLLRADPDVIMVGEMRDRETASIGVEAALTGHLVLSTLHTNSAPETIARLHDIGIDTLSFSDALVAVLAQRLARSVCPYCKEIYAASPEEVEELSNLYGPDEFTIFIAKGPIQLARGKGCHQCQGRGYYGRIALHEILQNSQALRRAIRRNAPPDKLRALAQEGGMKTLLQDGIEKCLEGLTDLSQVLAVSNIV